MGILSVALFRSEKNAVLRRRMKAVADRLTAALTPEERRKEQTEALRHIYAIDNGQCTRFAGEGSVLIQTSGHLEPAEEKDGVQSPEADPAPETEMTAEPTPEEQPADAPSEPEPEKEKPEKKAPPKKAPPKKAPPRRPPPKTTGQLLIGLLVKIAVTVGIVWAVFTFALGLSVHYGNNMYPAIHDGDLLVSFRLQKPFINSVVLYRINGKTEVGRVIALEGSVIDITENGTLTINGVAPTAEIFYATFRAENSPIKFPYTVESGKVFILNDFREDTNDSRAFGAVDKKDLQGPMLFTVRRRNF